MTQTQETDAELVERVRKEMQAVIDDTDWDAPTIDAVIESAGGKPELKQVYLHEVTRVGTFDVKLPEHRVLAFPRAALVALQRHVVCRHMDGTVFVLHLLKARELENFGHVTITAWTNQNKN